MKTLLLSPVTLILISIFCISTTMFGSKTDSLYSFEIDGKVFIPKNEDLRSYKLVLICHNNVVDSGTIVDDESFLLRVKNNSLYTIRIIKDGYTPMVVTIDTRKKEYGSGNKKFNFDGGYFLSLHGFHLSLSLRNLSSTEEEYVKN